MKLIANLLSLFVVITLVSAAAFAQDDKPVVRQPFLVPIPEKLERATVENEDGVLVWAEFEAVPCVNCKGKKKMQCIHRFRFDDGDIEECPECENTREAVCRICAGVGKMPDILERAPCPTCAGAAVTPCFICGGRGAFPVAGGGDRLQNCGSCDGLGAYPCQTCRGKRWIAPPKLKPSVGEAKLKDLRKALVDLEKLAAALAVFESTGDGRKDIKAMAKVLAPGRRYFPGTKAAAKHFERSTKDQAKGAVWQGYAANVVNSANTAKAALEYYLKHQRRLLELCIARLDPDDGTDDGTDDKDK